jgi:serine/threonine-protein kinase
MIRRILKFGMLAVAFFMISGVSAYLALNFFITSEPGTVVPDLSGKHVVAALELLSDLSLNTKVKGMNYSSDIPVHHVISQNPRPGVEIKPGRDVRITLSKGPETVVVPSLRGMTFNQAKIVLDENGLSVNNVARVYHARSSEGVILAQIPFPGKTIHREQAVDLLVSLGKRPDDFIMPDLSGLSIEEAIQRLERAQLSLGSVSSATLPNRPIDKIIDQSPSPGHRVFSENTVNLTINRDKTSGNKPFAFGNGLRLLRHTPAPGFLNRHVRVRLNCYGLSVDLFDTFVNPGRELWCFIPIGTNTAAFLYEDNLLLKSEVIE